jgi:hypothetical protein
MTVPAVAAKCLLAALGIGGALGGLYDFLRPLRPRLTGLTDLLFVIAALWGWVYLTFGVCGGDSRLGCTLGMLIGGVLWECSLGWLLRPVWKGFWLVFLWPGKKIANIFYKFYIFMLAIGKKWFTIVETMMIKAKGGADHGEKQAHQADPAKNQPRHKSRHRVRDHSVPSGSGGAVRHHRPASKSI